MTDVRFQVKFGPQDWRFYEDSANAVLADAYSRKERNTEVRIGRNGTYIVDFTSWSQFQKADPTKRRKVRIFDAKKSKPHHSHRHPTKSSSPSAHSKKSYDDPAKYIGMSKYFCWCPKIAVQFHTHANLHLDFPL